MGNSLRPLTCLRCGLGGSAQSAAFHRLRLVIEDRRVDVAEANRPVAVVAAV
jgi:hypothetical protein